MAFVLVTNDITPYYRDAIALLALRHGMLYRFRYDRSLIGDIDVAKMNGADGLVLLRQRTTAKLAPIRRIRINRVTSSAYFSFLEFLVTDFPDLTKTSDFGVLIATLSRDAAENHVGGIMRPLVYSAPDELIQGICGSPIDAASEVSISLDRWRAVIDNLAHFEHMSSTCFLNLYSIEEDGTEVSRRRMRDGMLIAYPHANYDLGIASYAFPPAPGTDADDAISEFTLVAKVDGARVSAVRDVATVVSRYDLHRLTVRAQSGIEGVGATVTIQPTNVPKQISTTPPITIPLVGHFAGWQWFSLIVGTGLYVAFFFVPKVWAGVLQAIGIIIVAAFGKDSAAALIRLLWNSVPLRHVRNALEHL